MRSIVTVVTANAAPLMFATLAQAKAELGLSGNDNDDYLTLQIKQAASAIQGWLGFVVAREVVTETFRPETRSSSDVLLLSRTPVKTLESVTLDGEELAEAGYELDVVSGLLYRLTEEDVPCAWWAGSSVSVDYTGGFALPGQADEDLDPSITAACLDLVARAWNARGRDAAIKAEDIPGVMRVDYWVGATGNSGELPSSVIEKIAHLRRFRL